MENDEHLEFIQEFDKTTKTPFILEDYLFREQVDFVRDPARFATAVCSVRAGKTTACAADLIDTAIHAPGTTGLYITLARSSAKRIVWPDLHRINREFKLGAQFNETELSIRFPNNSVIYCSGANTEAETEKLRGLSNVILVYIDESQAFRSHLKELVDDVLVKRLYDTNGRCRLIGTPGPIPAGYFYDACQSNQWSHHAWTLHSNPWIERKSGKTVNELIQQDMDRKGVDINDPSIQRECFGRWVLDSNALLLNYNPDLNHYDTLPNGNWSYILGMDFGFNDADSFSVLGWTDTSPDTYLIEEDIKEKQTYEDMEANFLKLHKAYEFKKVKADPGGGGKKLIESLQRRYKVPFEVAEKTEKIANYGLLNNALRTGRFKAKKTSRFAQDCNILEKDMDKSTPDKTVVKGHSDSVDSALYAFKESPAYYYTPPVKAPVLTDSDREEQLFEHHVEKLKRDKEVKEGQEYGHWNTDHQGIPDWLKWSD